MDPRFPLTRGQIERVVAAFYGKVRTDHVLGPIFAAHISDWSAHETKVANFWGNAILNERDYDGNPMQAHIAAKNVKPDHFERWLALFDNVLSDQLPEDVAGTWSFLAHRIGRGLSLGLAYNSRSNGDVPRLKT